MVYSFGLFVLGLIEIGWGFWGDFVDRSPNPSPSVASRFEAGIILLLTSFVVYLFVRNRTRKIQ